MKQFSKEIRDKECIRKNQGPTGNSLETNFYLSPLFCFLDTKNLFTGHFSLRQQGVG